MVWSLLELHAHDTATTSEFSGTVANKQMCKVLHRYLAFKGDAATTGSVGAYTGGSSLQFGGVIAGHQLVILAWVGFACLEIHR